MVFQASAACIKSLYRLILAHTYTYAGGAARSSGGPQRWLVLVLSGVHNALTKSVIFWHKREREESEQQLLVDVPPNGRESKFKIMAAPLNVCCYAFSPYIMQYAAALLSGPLYCTRPPRITPPRGRRWRRRLSENYTPICFYFMHIQLLTQ